MMRMSRNGMSLLLAIAYTVGVGGSAYSAESESQVRQADVSTILFFVVFAVLTLLISFWTARRATSSSEYLTAGSSISSGQNGLAIAGDYMSAGAFLGLSGAIYASGLDGMFLAASYLASWPIVLFLVAEPLRRLGKYSFADVLTHKLRERPVRILAGSSTLVIVSFYLVAQMVGAGELISLLFGIGYAPAIIMVGMLMIVFSTLGGMRAATWVQIIKAVLMIGGSTLIAALVLVRFGFSMPDLFKTAVSNHPNGDRIMDIRGFAQDGIATLSIGVGVLFGTAGLPHILMRFFTVSDERAARLSVFYATCLICLFFVMLFFIGYGSIALLRGDATYAGANGVLFGGNNLAPIHLARAVGGSILAGFISAVAFATILAVVSGLLIAGASSAANDLVVGLSGRQLTERTRLQISRISAVALGVLGILLGLACEGQNVAYLLALATAIAASANFPLLILAVYWDGLTTRGAVIGGTFGLVSSVVLTAMGPTIWSKVLGLGPAIFPYDSPALFTLPLTLLVCWLVSIAKAEPEGDWRLTEPSVAQYVE
ncbi:cation/acetate symporter [Bradyrhizobium sp. USDA 4341]|uniref:Cation/acetate symporter n=1 Tax=Bradyrhizobium erythrophlei TaxID=1437360 RepID=A0A1H4XAQ5_9BRAD|nr:cation/acetate symporter ActP [Bradyrhizobium erythrophlei]SED02657.1 cation/acetate symporter [Bradyrhizobium erythrophlei]